MIFIALYLVTKNEHLFYPTCPFSNIILFWLMYERITVFQAITKNIVELFFFALWYSKGHFSNPSPEGQWQLLLQSELQNIVIMLEMFRQ
jgi:hypothetical protein